MRGSRRFCAALAAVGLVAAGCGGASSSTSSGGGQTRKVLIDYKHDEFAGSFLRYYPSKISVRPGDTVRFEQTWSGEPHSVTMGTVVDGTFEVQPILEKYHTADEARAGGETEEFITHVTDILSKLPPMTGSGHTTINQAGARPCYIGDFAQVPTFVDAEKDQVLDNVKCPTEGQPQPTFNGRQALYNSGFIPYQGAKGNTYEVPIAVDAKPGTYRYFCNYHWTQMSGTLEILPKTGAVPSQTAVSAQARKEIARDAAGALRQVRKATKGAFDGAPLPLVGRSTGNDNDQVSINEFFPKTVDARVGRPLTWTVQGFAHTISFNVPKYFPVFTVAKNGTVKWDSKSFEAVSWSVPPPPQDQGDGPGGEQHRMVDVGAWDGTGGFHSSGLLGQGDTFTMTFTKPGTYLYACVLHPPMVAKVVVKA